MEILKTNPEESNFHLFENFPQMLYSSDSIRHKQSENINREFLNACYVLVVNGEVKARAALYNNPYLGYGGMKSACIGNYESIDNKEISEKLLQHTIAEAQKSGTKFLIGPMNGSTWDNYRFSTHHEYANFLLEPYHHLFYNEQFLACGFMSISNYTSSIDKDIHCDHPDVLKKDDEFHKKGVNIRTINMHDYEKELKKLYPFISVAFKTNFLYTPISWETFLNKYTEAAKIINPDYVLLAEDTKGNLIGFIFCYDDLFNCREKNLVIKTIARHHSKQWTGLGHVMANRVIRFVKNKGYKSLVHAFMIQEATSTNISRNFSGTIYKNYTLYGKKI